MQHAPVQQSGGQPTPVGHPPGVTASNSGGPVNGAGASGPGASAAATDPATSNPTATPTATTTTTPTAAPTGGTATPTTTFPDHTRNLMINFLPPNWRTQQLQTLFAEHGPIESCKIVDDLKTQQSKGFGFVKFVTPTAAEAARRACNGLEVEGKTLKVNYAQQPANAAEGPIVVYCAGFADETDTEEIRQMVQPYGKVLELNKLQGKPGMKGIVFVKYPTLQNAQDCVQNLNGHVLKDGERLVAKLADVNKRRHNTYNNNQHLRHANPYGGPRGAPLQPHMRGSGPGPRRPDGARPEEFIGTTLFVYGIPPGQDERWLWQLCGPFGAVNRVDMPTGPNSRPRGYAFVHMTNYYEAVAAVSNLNNSIPQGCPKPLQVTIRIPPTGHPTQ